MDKGRGVRGEKRRESVAERLERHPEVKARVERLLNLLENSGGDLTRADEAGRRAVDELRAMGQEVLQGWGQALADKEAWQLEAGHPVTRQVKKTALDLHVR